MTVGAHEETQHLTLTYAYPEHEPRENDPHYRIFNQTRRRLKKLGKLTCWIGNADCSAGPIELHHSLVEFSLAEIVDADHFAKLYPEFHIESDDDFMAWIEGEGNLLPLCVMHHRGVLGVHSIHHPAWIVQRYIKAGVAAPERKVLQ